MTRKKKRLAVIFIGMVLLSLSVGLILFALRKQTAYFHTPADLLVTPVKAGERVRLGGLVAAGSIKRLGGTFIRFAVEDSKNRLIVHYQGILPDIFREKQGVIAEGTFDTDGLFRADRVLSKHDENYMPREIADKLKAQSSKRDMEP